MQNRTVLVSVVVAMMLAMGCMAHERASFPMTGSSMVPAASGAVTLRDRDQANKTLQVDVHHLALPDNLPANVVPNGPAHAWVVWVEAVGSNAPENVGVLVPDQNLDAQLITTTAQKKFEVFVTPEPSPTQSMPTGQRLLQATVQ